jgi:DNA-binding response OmpR family regulator
MNTPSPHPGSSRILVVDDDPDVLQVIKRRLETFHYEVLKASNGEDGLRIAEEQQPDLVLLDIMMPKMKGRDVCLKLKANPRTARIPVIFLTALGLADHIKAGMDAGAEDYIVKPYTAAQLRERIMVTLARHQDDATREPS